MIINIKQPTYSQQQQGGGGKSAPPPPPAPKADPIPEPKPFEAAGEKPAGATSESQMISAGRTGSKGLRIDLGSTGGSGSGLSIPS